MDQFSFKENKVDFKQRRHFQKLGKFYLPGGPFGLGLGGGGGGGLGLGGGGFGGGGGGDGR